MSEEKEKKGITKKNVINTLCECNINTFVYFFLIRKYLVILVLLSIYNGQVPSTCFQTVEQIEVVKEVVLPVIYKLNGSVINRKQCDQTQFSPEKGKWVYCYLYIPYLLSRRQTNKQTIHSFNDIQAPGLHIKQYYIFYNTVIIMMIIT